jgi:hypothetical protein
LKNASTIDEVLPRTSSRQSAKEKQPKIKKGCWVKIQRSFLYHIAKPVQWVIMPGSEANTYNICCTIINGNSSKGWDVQFDLFPLEDNIVRYSTRTKLTVLEKDEEEKKYDRRPTDLSDYTNDFKMPSRANKSTPDKPHR